MYEVASPGNFENEIKFTGICTVNLYCTSTLRLVQILEQVSGSREKQNNNVKTCMLMDIHIQKLTS